MDKHEPRTIVRVLASSALALALLLIDGTPATAQQADTAATPVTTTTDDDDGFDWGLLGLLGLAGLAGLRRRDDTRTYDTTARRTP
jgi:MYXO-CTERM domain-containing protein